MNRIVPIAKKFLMSEPFFKDGFEYQFISVEPDSDWAIKFTVTYYYPKKVNLLSWTNLVMTLAIL